MTVSVKMSSKNQIVVPRAAREALGLKPGDRLLVTVFDDVVQLEKQPPDLEDRLEGVLPAGTSPDGTWSELDHAT